jgi:hypothetical protein
MNRLKHHNENVNIFNHPYLAVNIVGYKFTLVHACH